MNVMNSLDYYSRQKEAWDDKELQCIKNYYQEKEMTISQIADIHRRTPGCISFKLKSLGLISHTTLSRGYLDYKNSKLYNEIILTSIIKGSERKEKRELKTKKESSLLNLKTKIEPIIVNSQSRELIDMRNEIVDLKKNVKEMLRLMNALYEFEIDNRQE